MSQAKWNWMSAIARGRFAAAGHLFAPVRSPITSYRNSSIAIAKAAATYFAIDRPALHRGFRKSFAVGTNRGLLIPGLVPAGTGD
jgi:hypothetical protein